MLLTIPLYHDKMPAKFQIKSVAEDE